MTTEVSEPTSEIERFIPESPIPRPRSKKPFFIFGIIIGCLTICSIVLAAILLFKTNTNPITDNQLCTNQHCVIAAGKLIESIDETVNPCEDFYQFVCGKWIKRTETAPGAAMLDQYAVMQNQINGDIADALTSSPNNVKSESNAVQNARILYQSCIDEQQIEREGVDLLLSLINTEFGGWPMLNGSSWNDSAFNLFDLLLKLRKYNHNILYMIDTSVDKRDLRTHTIEISQNIIGKEHLYYTSTPAFLAYTKFMHDVAVALTNDTSMISQDIADVVKFEISNILHFKLGQSDYQISTTVGDLADTLTTEFDFTGYIRSAYSWAGITLLDSDIVAINDPLNLQLLSSKMNETSPRTLQNYAIWRFLINQVDHMPKRFREMKEKFTNSVKGVTTIPKRNKTCAQYVNEKMPMAVGKVYIKKFFDKNMRTEASEMFRNIRNEFINLLNQSSWMDEVSKRQTMLKVKAIRESIGYPDYLAKDNARELEDEYAGYAFDTSLMSNNLELLQLQAKKDLRYLRQAPFSNVWSFAPPTSVGAQYHLLKNEIFIPAAMLQSPFFNKDVPRYLNYGGIGTVIGHETTHSLDTAGIFIDDKGNMGRSLTLTTQNQFHSRRKCFLDQYNNYTLQNINMTGNASRTEDEDIADNVGLRQAFFAYQRWAKANPNVDKLLPGLSKYTPEQLFFINYAHTRCEKISDSLTKIISLVGVHSFEQFRVRGSISNFDEFDRAFKCRPGQGNSLINKCVLW